MQIKTGNCKKTGESTNHEYIAVGEVDQTHNTVDHGVTQGNEGINKAKLQAVDSLLNKKGRVIQQCLAKLKNSQSAQDDKK